MSFDEVKAGLLKEIVEFEIIDCHEHLGPESSRTTTEVSALNLFGHYTHLDLITAGMSEADYGKLHDSDYPLEYRWGLFRPYLDEIRFGSYARAAFIAAKELYGFDDISDETYGELSAAMQEANTPGIYQRILRDKCKIRYSLTQCGSTDLDSEILIPLMPTTNYCSITAWEQVVERARNLGRSVNTLDEYVALMDAGLAKWCAEGAAGIKSRCNPYPDGDRQQAVEAFEALRTGAVATIPELHPLNTWLMERLFELAPKHDMVVAVHAGMWGNHTLLDVKHMIPLFMRHPETTFDLYHLSFPSVHDAVIVGKTFANVYTNLCWTHIMSPTMTREGMRELLDFVPVNKVFAFGADYGSQAVDKVIGHLRMAQDNIAHVLAERVTDGLMSSAQAVEIAHKWFWDNPVKAYGLEV